MTQLLAHKPENFLSLPRRQLLYFRNNLGRTHVKSLRLKKGFAKGNFVPFKTVCKTILRAGNQAAPLAFPDAAVDVAELLKR